LHIKANLGAFLVSNLGFLIELHSVNIDTHTDTDTHTHALCNLIKVYNFTTLPTPSN